MGLSNICRYICFIFANWSKQIGFSPAINKLCFCATESRHHVPSWLPYSHHEKQCTVSVTWHSNFCYHDNCRRGSSHRQPCMCPRDQREENATPKSPPVKWAATGTNARVTKQSETTCCGGPLSFAGNF